MSYPRDLDEYALAELEAELQRRACLRASGRCDYCGQPPTQPSCRFPARHGKPPPVAAPVKIRARDVRPYHFAIWCSVGGGKPHANTIALVKWSETWQQIVFCLESLNFDFRDPDEIVELIPVVPSAFAAERYGPDSGWTLEEPPAGWPGRAA